MNMPIARQFARFVCADTGIPRPALHEADRAILDALSAIVAGGALYSNS